MTPQLILNPNAGQENAAKAFFEFLLTSGKEFIIAGAAGVGKTFLMSYIIDKIMVQYQKTCELLGIEPEYTEVVMTATTNKAAEVLGNATGRPTSTIHSYLNIRVSEDYQTGKTVLTRTRDWHVKRNKIIFIDECSMIDSDLYHILHEGTENCKIVYVGDHNQLAPVFEKISPIYLQGSPFYELTEPMRNNGQPALMAICQQLRETVESGEFKPIQVVPGVIDWLSDGEMLQGIQDTFIPGPNLNSRILAYTNKMVIQYNQYIRELRQLPALYTAGEVLVSNGSTKVGSTQLSVEQEITIKEVQNTRIIEITKDSELEVQQVTLETSFGEVVYNALLPVDRDHYDKLIKWFAKTKNWERMYFLKNNFPDLRPRDAATVHKSQGSTYQSVFIDLDNISKVTNPDMAARMLYVAFSRAKERVFLYGNLTERFGGIIE
ncbi:DNA helicase [Agrobacterium phage OLIVR2]|uniref:DNA helicase n=1 Tax=Agrobacterium phage OLIVR1 TaxID=2723769 RepID=A0A858MXJ2_9CAUD|nr:AAA family ATPase [Xanthomonas campestris]YP_010107104.1 DNA helicase [Agrobacterium phage OLIVR1]QIW87373.1 DNA helicase [Agrobacterium phage OLIVR2]QIW87480.1 DNA helicase [Agrobacterium phage OLIVR3]MCF8861652.1 AAA family ATPase [Xanthomonas campestris pv. campestris]QIW87265.1 DNA helicase [Agrobacterium phage OLIVR1]